MTLVTPKLEKMPLPELEALINNWISAAEQMSPHGLFTTGVVSAIKQANAIYARRKREEDKPDAQK